MVILNHKSLLLQLWMLILSINFSVPNQKCLIWWDYQKSKTNIIHFRYNSKEIRRDKAQITILIQFKALGSLNSWSTCKKLLNGPMTISMDIIADSVLEKGHICLDKKTGLHSKKKFREVNKDHFMQSLTDTPDFRQHISANKIFTGSFHHSKMNYMIQIHATKYKKFAPS